MTAGILLKKVKQAGENPYEKALKKYAVGSLYVGTVSMVDTTGVFVSLDGGIDCLCTYPKRGRPPRGCRVSVRILGINYESNRIWGVITHMSAELDRIFKRIYEDDISGAISHDRFLKLSAEYEAEQRELEEKVKADQQEVDTYEQNKSDFDSFAAIVRKYVGIKELTPAIVNEFIKKIIVYAPEKVDGKRMQKVDIVFNFVGEINFLSATEPKRQGA